MGRARLSTHADQRWRAWRRPLETERPSPRYSGIDLWSPAEILDSMIEGQFAAVAAVHAARPALERAALAIGIANNPDTPLLNEADHPVCLDTGAEPIAGSTRMKAGTAQRVALTLLSSLVMIRLGRVYEGLMVDVQPSNRKLVRRSEAILGQLTGHSREHVRDALRQAKGSVKLARLLLEGQALDEARGVLAETGGDLRAAKTLLEGRRTQKKRA